MAFTVIRIEPDLNPTSLTVSSLMPDSQSGFSEDIFSILELKNKSNGRSLDLKFYFRSFRSIILRERERGAQLDLKNGPEVLKQYLNTLDKTCYKENDL